MIMIVPPLSVYLLVCVCLYHPNNYQSEYKADEEGARQRQ